MSKYKLNYTISIVLFTAVAFFGQINVSYSETDGAKTSTVVNGLDTTKMNGLIEYLKKNPDKGQVTYYSTAQWQDGMRSFTGFSGYSVDGQMMHEKTHKFVILGDESTEVGGTDTAPGAVEELMYALSTCVIAEANANAALMGVKLTRLNVKIESDVDLHGPFALNPDARPGLKNMRMDITVSGDADDEVLKKIATLGYEYSPVYDTLRNGIKFTPKITVLK